MKINPEIHRVIRIHLSGNPTPEETEFLYRWLAESDQNVQTYHEIQKVWRKRSADPQLSNTEALAEEIWQRAQKNPPELNRFQAVAWQHWIKVAAVILIIITSVFTIYITQISSPEAVVSQNDAILKSNPPGQKSKFKLPDGTVVWLNAASSLRYRTTEFDSVRKVELEGEGFFEVVKDDARPFVVRSGVVQTTALGTAFNVRAYEGQPTLEVALVEGKVKIEEGVSAKILNPGTALRYDKQSEEMSTYPFSTESVVGWKDGILTFNGESFEGFVAKIERWYGVDISVSGPIPADWSLSGHYDNVSLAFLLDDIKFGKNFNYRIAENQVSLSF